jgi:hypothetical protein
MKVYMAILTGMLGQAACNAMPPGEKISIPAHQYLVSAEMKSTVSVETLKKSYSNISFIIKNGYTAYRLTYNTTDAEGKAVVASGAVFVPDIHTALPLLNYNHGTIFPSQEHQAPSYLRNNAEAAIGKLFSAAGYLVVVPDYVGYGSTKNSVHPYGAYHIIAQSVTDMLYAAKEFCADKKIPLSGKNFFSGWSEGAAVALAVVQKLETQPEKSFVPTASVLNAGPYYSSAFVDHILDADQPLKYMPTYVWVLRSYNKVYGINRPDNYYFTEPSATALAKDAEADISHDPRVLFTESFRQSYRSGKDSALKKALVQNDLWDWKPNSSIVFCHGDRDDYVPVFNSEKAYGEMKAKGADVELKIFKGETHTSGVFQFLQATFKAFEGKR